MSTEQDKRHPTDAEVVAWLDEHCEHGWSCIKIDGDWRASGSVGGRPHTSLRDEPRNARAGLARALGMGAKPVCPLPQVGEWAWCSGHRYAGSFHAPTDDGELFVWPFGKHWRWSVVERGKECLQRGITRTRRGAMRAAERAARKAWSVRNG